MPRHHLILVFHSLLFASFAIAEEAKPLPAERRRSIQLELDRNHEAIHGMYSMLESTPAEEQSERSYLESQIEQFDARNNVLFDELDAIDRTELQQHRRHQLQAYADRLHTQAKRSDSSKSSVDQIQADLLKRELSDNQWEEFIGGTWDKQHDAEITGPIQLFVENTKLRAEVESLKRQLAALNKRTLELEKRLHEKTSKPATAK